jgi:hypothetical protein
MEIAVKKIGTQSTPMLDASVFYSGGGDVFNGLGGY